MASQHNILQLPATSPASATRERIDLNVVALCRTAVKYDVPVVLSTVGVDMGANQGTAGVIKDELPGVQEIDRSGVNAWEDADFRTPIELPPQT